MHPIDSNLVLSRTQRKNRNRRDRRREELAMNVRTIDDHAKEVAIDPGAEFARPDGKSLTGLVAFIRRNPDCTLRGGEGKLLVDEITRLATVIANMREPDVYAKPG